MLSFTKKVLNLSLYLINYDFKKKLKKKKNDLMGYSMISFQLLNKLNNTKYNDENVELLFY